MATALRREFMARDDYKQFAWDNDRNLDRVTAKTRSKLANAQAAVIKQMEKEKKRDGRRK
jgi:hypothetical protein